jgi:hypothetical protein
VNNQNEEIKQGDLVNIDMYGRIVKATGSPNGALIGVALDHYGNEVTVYNNTAMASVSRFPAPPICVVCKRSDHEIPSYYEYRGLKYDHPFLKDNLELLEWRYEQSLK